MGGRVAVGEAVRPHGLKGGLRVRPWLEDLAAYAGITEVFLKSDPARRLEVESVHPGGKGAIVWKFKGIDGPEAAEGLRGQVFLADRANLRGQAEGVLYWEDFEGCEAADESGEILGRFENMFGAGGNDVLVVRAPDGGELLVPALKGVILRREGNRWILRPPRFEDED